MRHAEGDMPRFIACHQPRGGDGLVRGGDVCAVRDDLLACRVELARQLDEQRVERTTNIVNEGDVVRINTQTGDYV